MHPLDATTLGAMPDYAGIIKARPTKNKGSVIGCKKVQKNGPVAQKPRTPLRLVSPKQAHRTYVLNKKLKQMIREQELHGEDAHCQKCGAIKTDNTRVKLVADHVGTRNQTDPDRYENLGVLCWKCNSKKGSIREDYRPEWFKKRMAELDREPVS